MNPQNLSYPVSGRKALSETDEKPIRFRSVFWNFAQFWPIIGLSCLMGGVASFVFLKRSQPLYSATTKILIRDETSSGQITEASVFEDLGLISRSGNIENEMEVLQSVNLMKSVVSNLKLQTVYHRQEGLRDIDLYRGCPIQLSAWSPTDSLRDAQAQWQVEPLDAVRYAVDWEGKRYEGRFGQLLVTDRGVLLFSRNKPGSAAGVGQSFRVTLRSTDAAATAIKGQMDIKYIGKRSTVLALTLQDPVMQRAKDILDELARVYDQSQLTDRKRIYVNTISFIDDRLGILTSELSDIESSVERLKSRGKILDPIAEMPLLREETQAYEKQLTENEIQLDIIRNIRTYLSREVERFDFIPSNLGINNLTLTGMLEHFNTLLLDKEKAASMLGSSNPQLKAMDRQLANLRSGILQNITGLEKDLQVTRSRLDGIKQRLQSRISGLPEQERLLIDVQRQQTIKQNLYLYLLQKKEESELSRTVAVSNNKVVEPAMSMGQVYPVARNVWALGLGAGFLLPIFIIGMLQALNTKVRGVDDIRRHTRVPLLGLINHSSNNHPVAVRGNSRSVISEMFRLIRANLQFIGVGTPANAILITSSVSGEGKSFVSLNLGITLALTGKKVLLIELDLRNPRIARTLGGSFKEGLGITQYLRSDDMHWSSVVRPSGLEQGLDIVCCGPIPPNPSELLMGQRIVMLFNEAKKVYDHIIIDSAPVGLVSDALLLGRLVDTTLYIVRKDITSLAHLEIIEETAALGKLPRPFVVLNAVRRTFLGYSQSHLYGYGYYQKDKSTTSWLKKSERALEPVPA
ncbi:MAG: polysaccharide biosynthesis tyrosine autokinase [Bacteroidetes bacterium]|nr:polysaccharide biosynthesis tyrosine autokinase [Bacteroidota bacterium]